jgi:hypothetical protein
MNIRKVWTVSFSPLQAPGNCPYKESMGSLPVTPKVDVSAVRSVGYAFLPALAAQSPLMMTWP